LITPDAIETVVRGIAIALEDNNARDNFERGEMAFLIDNTGVTLCRPGPPPPPWPEMVAEVSPN
jgi:hypothetical protein